MPVSSPCLLLLVSMFAFRAAAQNYPWYLVDATSVVCTSADPPAPGKVQLQIETDTVITKADRPTPHVLTFYRTSNHSVSITLEVTDNATKQVIKPVTIKLGSFTSRRLMVEGQEVWVDEVDILSPNSSTPREAISEGLDDASEEVLEEVEQNDLAEEEQESEKEDEEPRARRLGGMRRRAYSSSSSSSSSSSYGSGSFHRRRAAPSSSSTFGGPRRRAPAPSTYGGPRRRSPSSTAAGSSSDIRRRASPLAARRRGSTPSGPQPQRGVQGSRFQNSNGQAYGYTQPARLNHNYPGGHTSTGYGYSGQNAYRPSAGMSTGTKMALAAAGGVVAGAGAAYLYSRWNSYGRCSSSIGNFHGSCDECYRSHGGHCSPDRLNEHANRDDLMQTGFWPDDWASPLIVTITAISGHDFAVNSICPPALGWNTTDGQDIFLTLTKVAGLADKLKKDHHGSSTLNSMMGLFVTLCCCAAIAGLLVKCCIAKSYQHEQEFHVHQQQQIGQPQFGFDQYGQPMPPPQFNQPPFGQPIGQQGVVMGTIVQPGQQTMPQGHYPPGASHPGGYQPGLYPA